jgi:hypothetical protein
MKIRERSEKSAEKSGNSFQRRNCIIKSGGKLSRELIKQKKSNIIL